MHGDKKAGQSSRRTFLKQAGLTVGAVGFPTVIPSRALGLAGSVAPSNRITLGFIGMGRMAKGHLGSFLNDADVQVLAICDVERGRREAQAKRVEDHYGQRDKDGSYKGCDAYNDFRVICARNDIDAMVIATPNQWHALTAIEAAKNGKDIYLEKPLTRTIGEGKALRNAVRRYGRILQTGSQQRSDRAFRFACELVRNGRIGAVKEVHVNVGGPPEEDYLAAEEVPEGLDWDLWLGPCPWRPYSSVLAPPESFDGWPRWRYYRPYAGGNMTDFGAHHFDIAQWGLGMDETGPVRVTPPDDQHAFLTYTYANGIRMYRGGARSGAAVEFVGTEGRVAVNRGQYLETDPAYLKREVFSPEETHLYESRDHKRNWLDSVRTRREPICPVEIGHRTATVCHIGNIAYWLNRPLDWDPETETFVDDPEANRLLDRPMRAPWRLT
jgi:predicted dehydrogenase